MSLLPARDLGQQWRRALTRVPPDGRVVHIQGDMAAALLPELQRGAAQHPGPAAQAEVAEPPGTVTSGVTSISGRRIIWRAVVQGGPMTTADVAAALISPRISERPIRWVLRDIARRNGHAPSQVYPWTSILASECV